MPRDARSRSPPVHPVRTRVPYSDSEDVGLIHFLVANGQLSHLKGNAVWREAAERKTEPERSWQSLKNRFWTNIVPNIDKYKLVNEEHRLLIRRVCYRSSDKTGDGDAESVASTSRSSGITSLDPYLCFLRDLEQRQSRQRRRSRANSRQSPDSDVTSSSASSAGEQDQRRQYTAAEDDAIISYILKRIAWTKKTGDQIHLRGRQFWDLMCKATRNIRSAQSLRERFLKRILPHLNDLMSDRPAEAAAIQEHAITSKPF